MSWLLLLALVASSRFFAALAWPVDLVANVSYFVAVPLALTALLALWRRRWAMMAAAVALSVMASWPIRFVLFPRIVDPTVVGAPGRHTVRVLEANVGATQQGLEGLIALIEEVEPDVVVAIEVLPGLERSFVERSAVRERLPFAIAPEPGLLWRDMMLTRWPLHKLKFDGDSERYKHLFAFRRSCFVDAPGGRFLLTAIHPASPRDVNSWQRGNEWTALLAEVCRHQLADAGVPVIVAGDFNTSPSGYRHRIMLKGSGFKPLDELGGLEGTWPSHWPGPLRMTIDRVWVSPDVEFVSREVLRDIGSDHRPILVTLSLPGAGALPPAAEDGR